MLHATPLRSLAQYDMNAMQDFDTSGKKISFKNSQRRIEYLWIGLMLLFAFCIFLPTLIGLDGFDGGFAIGFVSGFMVIISFVVILVYHSRANQLNQILSGEGRIAVWHYSAEEWMRFVEKDFEEEKRLKRNLFFLVAAIAILIGLILALAVGDLIFIPIVLGIIGVVAIPAFLAPRFRYRKLRNSPAWVLIAENGVMVGKVFHLWVKLGASLDKVALNDQSYPQLIEFTYSMPSRHGRQEGVARVPVPYGKTEEAENVLRHFHIKNIKTS